MSDATTADADAAKDSKEPAARKGGSKLPIIIAAAVLALGAGGGGVWFFVNKGHAEEASADSGEEGEHDAKDARSAKKEKGKKGKKGKDAEPKAPAIYVEFQPPFVVNFDAKGVMRFLQVSIQVLTRDHETSELIKQNEPKVRNDMLMLLGAQTLDTISTTQAKEALRKQALGAIVKIVEDEGGEGKKVEDLYFTSFVMQ
ncbi:MAG TPA: flagellar basal body-associated FliL family protein [Steroidobacteraceae bacterium]|nr:flagellar basal body-associated FliL family protein [Steroidobacteraceae bacterium]